jgi:hypothetical protein
MFNPLDASKSPLSSRVALPVALMMAGIFGLGIALIQPTAISKNSTAAAAAPPLEKPRSGGMPAANPKSDDPTPAGDDLVSFCSRHVTAKRSFVVFKRGTCVVINEPCKNPMEEALRILAKCKDPEARFVTEPTSDGEMIVAFKDPVFHRFSHNELEQLQPWLKQTATALLTPQESVTAGDGWVPPDHAKIGLLARRRLVEDATHAVPVRIIRAKQRELVAR